MKKDFLSIESATFGYARRSVLKNVSFEAREGSINCVFGRNGSGKTTLLRSLAGLLKLHGGRICINEKDLLHTTPSDRAKLMAIVQSGRPHIEHMTAADFVAYGRYPYTSWIASMTLEDEEKVRCCMESCGISDLGQRLLGELSEGEVQKVQIARVLAQDVPLLLLDELASHLDLVNKAEVFKMVMRLAAEGRTILFTSHDIQFSLQLADNFILIRDGQAEFHDKEAFRKSKIYEEVMRSDLFEFNADTYALRFKG